MGVEAWAHLRRVEPEIFHGSVRFAEEAVVSFYQLCTTTSITVLWHRFETTYLLLARLAYPTEVNRKRVRQMIGACRDLHPYVGASYRFRTLDRTRESFFEEQCLSAGTNRFLGVSVVEESYAGRTGPSVGSRDRRIHVPHSASVVKGRGDGKVATEALKERTKRMLLRTRRNTDGRK